MTCPLNASKHSKIDGGMASHWIGNYGAVKDFDEMVEFLTDELQGEFKITQF